MNQLVASFINYVSVYVIIGYAVSIAACYKETIKNIKSCWINIFIESVALTILAFAYPIILVSYIYVRIKYPQTFKTK
jgi:hypothetical protein